MNFFVEFLVVPQDGRELSVDGGHQKDGYNQLVSDQCKRQDDLPQAEFTIKL